MRTTPGIIVGVVAVIAAAGGGYLAGHAAHPAPPPPAPAAAASTPAAATTPASDPNDPVLASVNGLKIHLSDVQAAAQDVPQQLQQLPQDQLFQLLISQQIDRKALLIAAQGAGLQNNPDVALSMQRASDTQLENAYMQQTIKPAVTDAAVQAEFQKDYAGKPGPAQVDARQILVKTEGQAKAIINALNHGASFAALAKRDSIDPGAATNSGELGWFTQAQMPAAFANIATAVFALQPGQYTQTPVQSQFGWHVLLCEGKRSAPPPALADVKTEIQQSLADAAIKATLASARANVKIQVYNADGTPGPQGAPAATPAPAPAPAGQ